jgi:hypothetical protein
MLDSHSQLAIPGESHFIAKMAGAPNRYQGPEGFTANGFLDDLLADERFREWRLPADSVRRALAESNPGSLADAFRAVYGAYAAQRGKPLYGDKTPGYVRHLPLLADLFPESRFVHLLRDGRDVVLSLREMDWGRKGELETLARFWRANIELASAARESLGARRYVEIRYEHLIEDPERALRHVCEFLELPYEPAMASYYERPDELADLLPDEEHHASARLPPTKGLRDWRTQMSPEDLAVFERVAGQGLDLAGYPRAT